MTLVSGGTTDLVVWMNQGSLVETASFGRSGDFTIGRVGGTGIAPAIAMLNIEGYDNDALRSIIRCEDENANVDFLMTTNTDGAALNMFFRGETELAGNLEVGGDLIVTAPTVPGAADDPGVAGTISWDADHIYICIATNTWKRVAIATW
jgi:hypothetical protein